MISRLAAAALGLALVSGAATAAPITNGFTLGFGFTEGTGQNRDFVAGTTDLEDAPDPNGTFDLGTIVAGDVIGLYGRIVSAKDSFKFTFNAPGSFIVAFDLNGYDLDANKDGTVDGTVTRSGLVNQSFAEGGAAGSTKKVVFSLTGPGNVTETETRFTNLVAGDPGEVLFTGAGGMYTLTVDGSQGPGKNIAALYDLNISAVPLPASILFLLGGLAGLGFVARRRATAA